MTPLALFLIACATVFLGSVQAAFSSLMRLSLRLMAERGGRSDRLGRYLDDPLQLFIPVRILIGLIACRRAIPFSSNTAFLWFAKASHNALRISAFSTGSRFRIGPCATLLR